MFIPDMLALEVGRVNPTQNQLTPLLPLHIPVQPEAEDRLLDYTLSQHVLEWRHGTCH